MSSTKSGKSKARVFQTSWVLNKFVLTFLAFVVWISFFDHSNLRSQHKMSQTLDEMEAKISHYRDKLQVVKQEHKDLANNIEKLAREKYNFGASNEDIFIIEPQKKIHERSR